MYKARERRLEIIRRRLLRKSTPRIQVSLILSLTALAGFLTSFTLLHSGVPWMWLRYPIAISIAYCVFLLLLALWLRLQRRGLNIGLPVLDFISSGPVGPVENLQFGGNGDFSGGGAGGSWGESVTSSGASSGGSASDALDLDIDLEGAWLILLAIVALVGGLIVAFYIIYIAPALLAEVLVDGALVTGLHRRVKAIDQRDWLRAAVRRTLIPALLVVLSFTIAGYALQRAIPGAHTMGQVWKHVMRR